MKFFTAFSSLFVAVAVAGCGGSSSTTPNPTQGGTGQANDAVARFDRFSYSGKSQEQAVPGPGQFLNPVLPGYHPDPSVLRVGEDYYLANSTFSHFPGIPVFHSKDLVSWRQIGNAIDRPGQLDLSGLEVSAGVFAPDISYHDGLFYIVSTCIACKMNFVITAKNPAGPWSDPVWFDYEGIDPSIFWDDDGKAYLLSTGNPQEPPRYNLHRALYVQEFDYKNLKLVGNRIQVINGGVDIAKQPISLEAPHVVKKDGFYYLMAAEGGTNEGHSEVIFRSKNIFGPFVPGPRNPILTQRTLDPKRAHPITSAGHAKMVQTQKGEWWATFLATRPYSNDNYNIGRETFLLPVQWKDGWPVIQEEGKEIPFVVNRPDLPVQPPATPPSNGDFSYVEEFRGAKLPVEWLGVRTPTKPLYELRDDSLIMRSSARIGDQTGVPGFIGRRQQHHVADIVTDLAFAPAHDGDRAGLVALQSDRSYVFFGITKVSGITGIALYARENTEQERLVAFQPTPQRVSALRIKADGGEMSFLFKQEANAKEQVLTTNFDVTFLSTKASGGFVGTLVGPYTYQQ